MIKTVVIPENNSYNLSIPEKYIGKKIEILLYALDEISEVKNVNPKKSLSDFAGIISEADYQALKASTEQARKEWNRDV